jgi:quercetin dioxygenase-like cupin family protein
MKAYTIEPDAGDARWMFDSLDTIKADAEQTDGRFAAIEFLAFEDSGPPMHVYDQAAAGLYVLDGEFTFSVDGERSDAVAGTWIFVPPGVERAWICRSKTARILSIVTPAGFEGFYREVGQAVHDRRQLPARSEPDVEALMATAAEHGARIVGPPLS